MFTIQHLQRLFIFGSPSSTLPTILFTEKPRGLKLYRIMALKNKGGARIPQSDEEFDRQSELLQSFYMIPNIDKAWMYQSHTGKNADVVVAMSQMNLLANTKRKFMSYVHLPLEIEDGNRSCNWSPFPFELNGVSLIVPSLSGRRLLIIRNGDTNNKNEPCPVKLEIWNSALLLKEIVVPPSIHGSVYADGWFEGVSWSQDELQVAYVAEEPAPAYPIYGKGSFKVDDSSEKDLGTWKGQGEWQEDWGESYTGKRRPILFVLDINSAVVKKVEGVPDNLSAGQVVWAPTMSNEGTRMLVFVGWPSSSGPFPTERRLGMKYCYNRPCSLYAVESPHFGRILTEDSSIPSVRKLTEFVNSAFWPRFSPNGKLLIFLSAKAAVDSGAHSATNSLYSLSWPVTSSTCSKLVVPVVMRPHNDFPGLYPQDVLGSPWLQDGKTLLLSTVWSSMQCIVAVNVESGQVARVTPSDEKSSWNLLSLYENHILAAKSSPRNPPTLVLGKYSLMNDALDPGQAWSWLSIHNPFMTYPEKVEATLSSITFDILKICIPSGASDTQMAEGAKQPFDAIFVSSKSPEVPYEVHEKRPLIVIIHGGPHSVSTTSFSKTSSFLSALGFNLLFVNYRGSLGLGEEALQSLPGHVGSQDVQDILAAVDFVIARGLADSSKIAILGGSHGGFLATHLIGQAPDRFVTAAVRNPVCNLSLMVGVSDIPDWCYVETFGKDGFKSYSESPSPDAMRAFYQASPIAYVSKVKVPTLFLLGAHDRRVPIANGFQYVQALRARGLEVKVIVFPEDNHALDRPQSDFESFVNIGVWFKRFFQT